MNKNIFILKNVEDFAPGAFENTIMEGGSLKLGAIGGQYMQSGCYTSPVFHLSPFIELVPSFNGGTPPGTTVEFQVRVYNSDGWSKWLSFGKWSPFMRRFSSNEKQGHVSVESEFLKINDKSMAVQTAQMRMFLYSDDLRKTPSISLMSVSVRPLKHGYEESVYVQRKLNVPSYSCVVRDPVLAMRMPSATSLAMLLNRWGEDVLPEEIARSIYDYSTGRFGNLVFLVAGAGAFGYECYLEYGGISTLKKEVKIGYCVGAMVNYRVRNLQDEQKADNGEEKYKIEEAVAAGEAPIWDGAIANSNGHSVVVYGFEHENDEEYILFCDPYSARDAEVQRRIKVKEFESIYTGLCLIFHKSNSKNVPFKPFRTSCNMEVKDDSLRLFDNNGVDIPATITDEKIAEHTFCCAFGNSQTYASVAQRRYYYFSIDANKKLVFDFPLASGNKTYFYCVGSLGETWVGEKEI